MSTRRRAASGQTVVGADMASPRLHVVIPCSKRKVSGGEPIATAKELETRRTPAHLEPYRCASRALYRGRQFRTMLEAVDRFRQQRPDIDMVVHIVSAGYGLLDENQSVVPYEATLGPNRRAWIERGRRLGLPGQLRELMDGNDIVVVALSEAYLVACGLPCDRPNLAPIIYLTVDRREVPTEAKAIWSGRRQARGLLTSEREVRGVVLQRLLTAVASRGLPVLGELDPDPLTWPEFAA